MNTCVKDLLDIKGHEVYGIDPDRTVFDAVKMMDELKIGSLLVSRADDPPLGIISEYDCRKVILTEQQPRLVKVSEMMSSQLVTVSPKTTVEECMQTMTEKRVRHLPVLDKGKVCGLLSIGDVVKFLYQDRDRMVQNLEKYITGSM